MTEVNFAEAKYALIKKDDGDAWAQAADIITSLPIEFHPADRRLADMAADFKARHKISLADAFSAALAKDRKAGLIKGGERLGPLTMLEL